ncbi:hypothetical protein GQ42DRAFT_163137 [Ramicandelaber brevisporus]|nr:hypothetical protein GQ42DRAFT_163137 [Ramicandelaber brevisporus]
MRLLAACVRRAATVTAAAALFALAATSGSHAIAASADAPFSISNVELGLVDPRGAVSAHQLSYPGQLSHVPTVDLDGRIKVSFTLHRNPSDDDESAPEPIRVHQAFLHFEHVDSDSNSNSNSGVIPSKALLPPGAAPVQVYAAVDGNRKGKYSLDMRLFRSAGSNYPAPAGNTFFLHPGVYSLELILGTFSVPQGMRYKLGNVRVVIGDDALRAEAQSMREDIANMYEKARFAKHPEIEHTFAPPHKMPPLVISLAFVGIVLSPWVLLVGAWTKLGVNVNGLKELSGGNSAAQVALLGCLGGWAALFFLYWTKLTLLQVLPYFVIHGGITAAATTFAVNSLKAIKHCD